MGFDIGSSIVGAVVGAALAAAIIAVGIIAAPIALAIIAGAIIGGIVAGMLGGSIDDCINVTREIGADIVNTLNKLTLPANFPISVEVNDVNATTRYFKSGTAVSTVTLNVRLSYNHNVSNSYRIDYIVNSIENAFKNHGFNNVSTNVNGNTIEIAACSKVDDKGRCVGDSISASILSDSDLSSSTEFVFLGQDPRGLTMNVIVAVIDGNSGGIKHIHTQRLTVKSSSLHARLTRCSCCDSFINALACPFYSIGYWLGLSGGWDNRHICGPPKTIDLFDAFILLSDFSLETTITFSFDGFLTSEDFIEIYVLSPMFVAQLRKLCSSGFIPEDYKDVCSQIEGKYCTSGYYLNPDLFEMVISSFGYYNDEILRLAIAVSNGGYLVYNEVKFLDENKLTYIVDSTEVTVERYEPTIDNDTITSIKKTTETYDLTKISDDTIEVANDATAVTVTVPVPYGLSIEGVDNSNYYMLIDPMGIFASLGTFDLMRLTNFFTDRGIVGQLGSNSLIAAYLPAYERDMGMLMAYGGKITLTVTKNNDVYFSSVSVTLNKDPTGGSGSRLSILLNKITDIALNSMSAAATIATPYPLIFYIFNLAEKIKGELENGETKTYIITVKDGGITLSEDTST